MKTLESLIAKLFNAGWDLFVRAPADSYVALQDAGRVFIECLSIALGTSGQQIARFIGALIWEYRTGLEDEYMPLPLPSWLTTGDGAIQGALEELEGLVEYLFFQFIEKRAA